MKKLFVLLLCLALTAGLCACGAAPAPTEAPLFPTEAPAAADATEAPADGAPKVDESQTQQENLQQALFRKLQFQCFSLHTFCGHILSRHNPHRFCQSAPCKFSISRVFWLFCFF